MGAVTPETASDRRLTRSNPADSPVVPAGLGPGPRRFLVFSALNVVSWQCIMGPPLVLFARKLDMPPSWVGLLLSFLALSMVLVVGTVGIIHRFGPKATMVGSWLLRDLVACSVFLVPWALSQSSSHTAWYALAGSTFGFCALRAFGVAGWFPWLCELIPASQRGTYFSRETVAVHGANVAVLLGQGVLLGSSPTVARFLLIHGIGIAAGLLSVVAITRIPGGKRLPASAVPARGFASYRLAFGDHRFVVFVLVASVSFSAVAWLHAALILFMRDAVRLSPATIVVILSIGSVGTMATITSWGRFADRCGSGRAMFKTLIAHGVVALSFLALLPGAAWTVPALFPAVTLAVVFSAAFFMAANRALLGFVPAANRVAYSNVWIVGTSLAFGLTPIAVGLAIDAIDMAGYRICFAVAGVTALAGAFGSRLAVRDGEPLRADLGRLLNLVLPLRVLARILWITLGR